MIRTTLLILLLPFVLLLGQSNLSNKYRLGQTYEQSGQLEKAKAIYEELTNAAPTNHQYARSLNNIYLKLKEYNNSILFLSNQIKQKPYDVSLYGMLGATYYISGNSEMAEQTWDKGIALNNYSQINYTIISSYATQNRAFDIAIKYLEEGKKKSKNKTQFSYQLSQIYSYTMSYSKAAKEYCFVLTEQPSQLSYIKRRMEVYLSAVGALEQSIKVVEKCDRKNAILELLSFLYMKNNHFEKAFEIKKELDSKKPNNGILIYTFANEAYRNSQLDVATKAFKYLINEYPNSQYVPNSKIGFAKTLEAKLDNNWNSNQQLWKPIYTLDTTGAYKYRQILNTYESIIPIAKGNLLNEVLFRIGKIYTTKILDYKTASKYYNRILQNSFLSSYYGKTYFEFAKMELHLNNLETTKENLQNVFSSSQTDKKTKAEAKFLLAKVEFYQANFAKSISILNNINENLSNDFSNDAIELSMLVNMGKKDSIDLALFAKAELKGYQQNFIDAEKSFKELSEKKNLFFLKNISRIKYAEILIAQNKYTTAIKVLKELSETKELNIFADKSFYLLAQVYEFGIVDKDSAITTYEKFLELFPNSLYLEKVQKSLKQLQNKRSENI
jgi:tetratricopeptide (TPR) repeat protein